MKLWIKQGESAARIKLELFCSGLKISEDIKNAAEFREIIRTRGGLGSGIELILPDHLWVNAPVNEKFCANTPLSLIIMDGKYWIQRNGEKIIQVHLAPSAEFYNKLTSTGIPMKQIGTLQGGYLAFFPTSECNFWPMDLNCQFCSTGLNLGTNERKIKSVEEVVEVAKAAFDEKLASFIHLNIGFDPTPDRGILKLAPYVKRLKEETDAIIICQCLPPENNEWADYAYSIGVDSMSSNFEFYDPEYFQKYCPGKTKFIGQKRFFEWMEYLPTIFPKGGAAGEIIIGIEPIESSLRAIDYITSVGAQPIVCAFRPLLGTALENLPPPTVEQIETAIVRAYQKCKENNIKMNAVDRVSIVMLASDGRLLIPEQKDNYRLSERIMDALARTQFGKKLFKNLVLDKTRKKFLKTHEISIQ